MPIISFWNNSKVETGETLSMIAMATYMALMHNYKILVVDTNFNTNTLKECFWKPEREKVMGAIGAKQTDISTGVEGLAKAVMSNKSSPEIITNYTKIVFKDRLEILLPMATSNIEEYKRTAPVYKDILQFAKKTYDIVFVDVPNGFNEVANDVLQVSDLIILNTHQKMQLVESLVEARNSNPTIFPKEKTMINLGKYDQYSKYNAKNLARVFGEKKELLTVPYCTQFFEATVEAETANYFIKFNRIMDMTDTNAIFIQEVKKDVERIIYRLQEMQMRM